VINKCDNVLDTLAFEMKFFRRKRNSKHEFTNMEVFITRGIIFSVSVKMPVLDKTNLQVHK